MFNFFSIVAEAVAELGVIGLLEEIPGGKYTAGLARVVVKM